MNKSVVLVATMVMSACLMYFSFNDTHQLRAAVNPEDSADNKSRASVKTEDGKAIDLPDNWSAYDLNEDGYADKSEVNEVTLNLDFTAADANGDGSLSRVEFLEMQEQIAAGDWLNGEEKEKAEKSGQPGADKATEGSNTPPLEVVENVPKRELKNPYSPDDEDIVARGHELFFENGCNGCHGGTGGGGMGPPLSNKRWVYGDEPDTLFRLIALGSTELLAAGYSRVARENVVGPMPAQGEIVDTEDDLWKIITWIQSLHE